MSDMQSPVMIGLQPPFSPLRLWSLARLAVDCGWSVAIRRIGRPITRKRLSERWRLLITRKHTSMTLWWWTDGGDFAAGELSTDDGNVAHLNHPIEPDEVPAILREEPA